MIVPYQHYYHQGPDVLGPDDAVVVKICAVRGWDDDWAAYKGLSDWPDEQVVESGDWYVPQGTSYPRKRRLRCFPALPSQD